MSSTLWPNRSKAAPARCLPRPATTSWPRLLILKYALLTAILSLWNVKMSQPLTPTFSPSAVVPEKDPLRHAAVARHEVMRVTEFGVRKDLEHPGERLTHTLASPVARAADFRARGALEDAVVGHEGHQDVDVVTVPAVAKERFQVLDRHHGLLAASTEISDMDRLTPQRRRPTRAMILRERALCQFPIHPSARAERHPVLCRR